MDWQFLIATVLVVGCAIYALRNIVPVLLPRRWRAGKAASSGACGGCSGCGPAAKPASAKSVIRVVRRHPDADVSR